MPRFTFTQLHTLTSCRLSALLKGHRLKPLRERRTLLIYYFCPYLDVFQLIPGFKPLSSQPQHKPASLTSAITGSTWEYFLWPLFLMHLKRAASCLDNVTPLFFFFLYRWDWSSDNFLSVCVQFNVILNNGLGTEQYNLLEMTNKLASSRLFTQSADAEQR